MCAFILFALLLNQIKTIADQFGEPVFRPKYRSQNIAQVLNGWIGSS